MWQWVPVVRIEGKRYVLSRDVPFLEIQSKANACNKLAKDNKISRILARETTNFRVLICFRPVLDTVLPWLRKFPIDYATTQKSISCLWLPWLLPGFKFSRVDQRPIRGHHRVFFARLKRGLKLSFRLLQNLETFLREFEPLWNNCHIAQLYSWFGCSVSRFSVNFTLLLHLFAPTTLSGIILHLFSLSCCISSDRRASLHVDILVISVLVFQVFAASSCFFCFIWWWELFYCPV